MYWGLRKDKVYYALDSIDGFMESDRYNKLSRRCLKNIGNGLDPKEFMDEAYYWIRRRYGNCYDEENCEENKKLPYHNAAILMASKAVSLQPDSLEFRETLGLAEYHAGLLHESVQHLQECVDGGYWHAQPLLALSLAKRGQEGDLEAANQNLIEYLQSHPMNIHVREVVQTLEMPPKTPLSDLEANLKDLLSQ